jgi:putative transposase
MPKLRHYDNLGTARFVTFCCYRLQQYFTDSGTIELLIAHINEARTKHGFKIFGYVIMPEHVHLVLLPPCGMKLGIVIREIKSKMAREYFALNMSNLVGKKVFWQKRCYDHNCRTDETVKGKIIYCHNNPVKRGLVGMPGDYEWSSYNFNEGKRDVPLMMDEYEL